MLSGTNFALNPVNLCLQSKSIIVVTFKENNNDSCNNIYVAVFTERNYNGPMTHNIFKSSGMDRLGNLVSLKTIEINNSRTKVITSRGNIHFSPSDEVSQTATTSRTSKIWWIHLSQQKSMP